MFDLIVRGGRVIDPSQNLDTVADVGVIGPRIAAIGPDISLFRLVEGEFRFRDSAGNEELGGTRLDPVAVVRNGRHYACSPGVYPRGDS